MREEARANITAAVCAHSGRPIRFAGEILWRADRTIAGEHRSKEWRKMREGKDRNGGSMSGSP